MQRQKTYEYSTHLKQYVVDASYSVFSFIYKSLFNNNIDCTNPKGAFYMIIGFNSFPEQIHKLGIRNSKELALYLLEKYQVALLPGSDFGFEETASSIFD